MDPLLQIFPELHDMVFHHFNANDFKNITLVSPFWNETIMKSQTMMKKVKLVIGGSQNDVFISVNEMEEIERTISFSRRRYQNVKVNGLVWSYNVDLNDAPEILKHLMILSSTLMELEIIDFNKFSVKSEKIFYNIDLHRLKVLKLFMVHSTFINILMGGCRSLESLEIVGDTPEGSVPVEAFSCLKLFLKQNQNLKKIKLK